MRRVRADGVVVKPYFAKGTTDVVAGYRAALKPAEYNDKLFFYGGSKLGRDLSLPRLREGWAASTPESAGEAVAEWQAAGAHEVAASNYAAFNEALTRVPVTDRAAWADAARDGAGVLSAWARLGLGWIRTTRPSCGPRRPRWDAPRSCARPPGESGRRVKESPMGTALILLAAAPGTDKAKVAGGVFLRQVLKTAEALREHHRAAANLGEAERMQREVVERLGRIQLVGYATSTSTQEVGPRSPEPEVGKRAREARERASALTGTGPPVGNSPAEQQVSERQGSGLLPRPLSRPHQRSTTDDRRERENDGR